MKVLLTVETYEGMPINVTAHLDRASAAFAEVVWLSESKIRTQQQRETKAGHGTKFLVHVTEVQT